MDKEREQMVRDIKLRYGLDSPKVLSVMLQIPREKFLTKKNRYLAYNDGPVSIGYGQTMSQPYTVAFMTHLAIGEKRYTVGGSNKVLEIGTGSGYQAAVLSKLFGKVYTIEIIPELARRAKKTLKKLGFKNVYVKVGSGEWGWEEKAPFDAIIITAGLEDKVPDTLLQQLKIGGVLVAPMGKGFDKVMTRYVKLKTPAYRQAGKTQMSNLKTKIRKPAKIVRIGESFYQVEEFGTFHFVPFIEEKN